MSPSDIDSAKDGPSTDIISELPKLHFLHVLYSNNFENAKFCVKEKVGFGTGVFLSTLM